MGYVHQLNSVDGRTYQSILPQPSVWQLGQIKELGCLKEFRVDRHRVDMPY